MPGVAPLVPGPPGSGPPVEAPIPDPCVERHQVGERLRGARLHGAAGTAGTAETAGASRAGQFDVFTAGAVFLDMIFTGLSGPPRPGTELWTDGLGTAPGGIANLAVAMSRLGLRVGLAAEFGDDVFGRYLWRTLAEQERVDLRHSRRTPNRPTPVTVSLSYDRDRSLITYSERARVPEPALPGPPPASTCFVHVDLDLPGWVETLRAQGGVVFGDVGWDPSGTWPPAVLDRLAGVDVFLPNAVEAMAYTRTASPAGALAALADLVPVVVVTAGPDGALAVDRHTGERAVEPALPVDDVLDPTGAGDVFDAAFVFGSLAGWPLAHRVRFANLCAGLSVRQYSGSLGAPCWGELATWWQEARQIPEFARDYAFLLPYLPDGATDPMPRAFPTLGYRGVDASGGAYR